MLEVVNRKLFKKHRKTTSGASGIKSGTCVPVKWGKVSTDPGGTFSSHELGFWIWLASTTDISIRAGEVPEGHHLWKDRDLAVAAESLQSILSHNHCPDCIQSWGCVDRGGDQGKDPRTLHISLWSSDMCRARARDAPGWNLKSDNFYVLMDIQECQNLGNGQNLWETVYPKTPGVKLQNKDVMLVGDIVV